MLFLLLHVDIKAKFLIFLLHNFVLFYKINFKNHINNNCCLFYNKTLINNQKFLIIAEPSLL